jgi:hypothetical protein
MGTYCEIKIDCPPGYPRPVNVLECVINNTENKIDDRDILNTLERWKPLISKGGGKFGNFIWRMPYTLDDDKFDTMKDILWTEIVKYYNSGTIRYSAIRKI